MTNLVISMVENHDLTSLTNWNLIRELARFKASDLVVRDDVVASSAGVLYRVTDRISGHIWRHCSIIRFSRV